MKKKMTLRFILLALGGLALGGAITYLWWLAAYQWKAAPAPFPDVAFFTGFGMILIGILALTSAGNLQAPTAAPGERGGPFQLFRSSKAVAKEAAASSKDSGRLALPGGGAAQRSPAGGLPSAPHRGSRGALLLDVKKRMAFPPSFFALSPARGKGFAGPASASPAMGELYKAHPPWSRLPARVLCPGGARPGPTEVAT